MFEEMSMRGRKVLITAGASGLGLEMAKVFTAAGASVLVCDVDAKTLEQASKAIPGLLTAVADVSDEASVAGLFDQVQARLSGLNVLVNRSEEHTSELQSLMRISYAVFCLKKKKKKTNAMR